MFRNATHIETYSTPGRKGLWLVCLLFSMALVFPCKANEALRRHYILLLDRSASYWDAGFDWHRETLEAALGEFLSNEIPKSTEGSVQNLKAEREAGIPFFDRDRDELTCFLFGMNFIDRDGIRRMLFYPKKQNHLYSEFAERLIHTCPESWRSSEAVSPKGFLHSFFTAPRPYWGNGISLSNLAYPVVLDRFHSEHYSEEYIILLVSDFRSGSTFGNSQDYLDVKDIFYRRPEYYQVIFDSVEALSATLYTIPYFQLRINTGRADDSDTPILLGVQAFKVKPYAGYPQPEIAPVALNNTPELRQEKHAESVFDFDPFDIRFGHNDRVRVNNVRVTLSTQYAVPDTLSVEHFSSAELDEAIAATSDTRYYQVPETELDLPSISTASLLGDLPLDLGIQLFGHYQIRSNKSLPFAWSLRTEIPNENIQLASALPGQLLGYGSVVIFLLALLGYLGHRGRPNDLNLQQDGFADTFEQTDYNSFGKRKTPYLAWTKQAAGISSQGFLEYHGTLFKHPAHVHLKLNIKSCPSGFELYLEDKNGVQHYPDHPLTFTKRIYDRKSRFEWRVVLKQIDEYATTDTIRFVHYTIEVSAFQNGLFRFHRHKVIDYAFQFGPQLGDVWLGIDPGTTGSCLASGSLSGNMVVEQDEGEDRIIPSVIAFEKDRSPVDLENLKYGSDYTAGDRANAEKASSKRYTAFQSIKKLLGYKNRMDIPFKYTSVLLNGIELTSLMVEAMIQEHQAFLETDQQRHRELLEDGQYRAERVAVAIPNNFTASKTGSIIESLRALDRFKEIRCIPEAEAVLIHYLFSGKRTEPKSGSEQVFIFDMGGATINVSVVEVTSRNTRDGVAYHIDILGKLGYGIGGDTIDYCLIKLLYEHLEEYPQLARFTPFKLPTSQPDRLKEFKAKHSEIALALKKMIILNYEAKSPALLEAIRLEDVLGDKLEISAPVKDEDRFMQHFIRQKHGYPLFDHSLFKSLIYKNVKSSVLDLIELAGKTPMDTVIFSGRSTRFPLIEDTVMKTLQDLGQKPKPVKLSDTERKSAVARGACLYGINRNAIHLSYLKANSYFGIQKTIRAGQTTFIPLIDIQTPFELNGKARVIAREQGVKDQFPLDNNRVNFLQIMGSDPEGILKRLERHKFSLLQKIPVQARTQAVGIAVEEDDTVHCWVKETGGQLDKQIALVNDQDVGDANDEHYTWML